MSLTVVPSIDLRHGQVVRLQQGDYSQQLNYPVDPIQTASAYAEAGATWMHIVDLDGAKEGRPVQTKLLAQIIAATPLRVQVGGGVRSTDDIRRLLEAGAERVVVGTKAIEDWDWFTALVADPAFAHKIVLAIDARDGVVATRGWTQASSRRAIGIAAEVSQWPLGALLYTDVSKDGMLIGPNVEQTQRLAEAGKVPVIASGGVGSLDHIRQLLGRGIWGVIVGRSLYEGKIKLREALELAAASAGS